ncbi:MAG: UDP-N-acetylmuramoyl-tripeptide--D-alanyl-D-alanine ligase [Glycomyces artemisiae]|uniref:UDP-N-acetylmuramoyl-tripeptide--D-alanyl-D-alanine ligase n=1 Tax=Glycomyces artemisiae TaxID=1076443 RepID=A0A850C4D9_9ACTN|nr:UDP-N-acetylmuramoyl-tripeptide--D-alanyl-D-alanine ligase [Glycomyces artemisiae]
MIPMSLAQVAAVTGGKLSETADPEAVVTGGVEFDSRKAGPGGLFLAIPGAKVDGHDFAAKAHEQGVVATIATRPVDTPAVYVDDAVAALTRLAKHIAANAKARIIGVTGSNGKTSTKDLIGQLCARLGPTVATEANFNNELGHPYTVCRTTPETEYLVLELAARGLGHITQLCDIAPPSIGVVLNVGISHLDGFGSIETTAKAKSELPQALGPDGTVLLNADDPRVAAMAGLTDATAWSFGVREKADIRAEDVDPGDGRHAFTLVTPAGSARVQLKLWGDHHVYNALAAAGVLWKLGATPEEIAEGLAESGRLSERRMDVFTRPDGTVVIDDSYNANPASMGAAVRALGLLPTEGRRIAVLGLMADLEELEEECHRRLGEQARDAGIDEVIAVGEGTQPIIDGADGVTATHVPDQAAAIALLENRLRPGDAVLVKGSRYRTWDVADHLRAKEETDQ